MILLWLVLASVGFYLLCGLPVALYDLIGNRRAYGEWTWGVALEDLAGGPLILVAFLLCLLEQAAEEG